MLGITFYPISVSKAYTNRRKGIKHRPKTKKVWYVYGYEHNEIDEELKFKSYRINPLQALYHKMNMAKLQDYDCPECGETSYALTKGFFERFKECTFCNGSDLDSY